RERVALSAAMLGGAILVLLVFSRRLVRPIRRLVAGTERIAGGDLAARVDVGRCSDELGALADSFNRMTGQLQEQRLEIVSYSQDLERKVASRTAQLAEANTRMQAANRRLEAQATTDALTGLWNRRRFIEMLERECQRGARTSAPLALAMLDVDRFKAVNDTFGHVFGDRVLVAMADRLHHAARGTDVVARYGGEEFMVLMPDTTAEEALNAAERIRKSIASHPISDDKRTVEVTVSIGISALGAGGAVSPESLVRLADETLYAAKQAGRNCTKTWNEVSRDAEEAVQTQAGEVEELQRRLASLSLEAKDGFVQSVQGLVRALEARDPFSRSHSENVTAYAVGIAGQMGLEPEELAVVRRAAWLHDIGKIGVPDAILRKPGPLTDEEQRVMRQHVLIGVRILEQMRFLEREVPLIRHHHERWDGRGYPDGIGGQAIARGARILTVADAFEALTSDRSFRKGIEVPDALRVLIESSGTQFDAEVIDALIRWVRAAGHAIGDLGAVTPDAMLDDETRASTKE
ncbi:MAG: diguanylate cyclase, partial [Planctomycetes bacterium]|nr:diguanylate cyclase [Planctomycetota bacterium]